MSRIFTSGSSGVLACVVTTVQGLFSVLSIRGTVNSEARQNNFYSDVVQRSQWKNHQHQTSQCFHILCGSVSVDNAPHYARAHTHTEDFFLTHGSVHRNSMLIKVQPDATVCRYLFTAKSLYMFRVL